MRFDPCCVLLSSIGLVFGQEPLTKTAAQVRAANLVKLRTFANQHRQLDFSQKVGTCSARASNFTTHCNNGTFQKQCRIQAGGSSINLPDETCCASGNLKCKNNPFGQEFASTVLRMPDDPIYEGDRCCPICTNTSHQNYSQYCTNAGTVGPAVCGTLASYCYTCLVDDGTGTGTLTIQNMNSKSDCENRGLCTSGSGIYQRTTCEASGTCSVQPNIFTNENTCTNGGGTWDANNFTAAVWTVVQGLTTQSTCRAANRCMRCSVAGMMSSDACTAAQGTVSEVPEHHLDGGACWGSGGFYVQNNSFSSGTTLPAHPLAAGMSCSTGPTQWEPAQLLPMQLCVDQATFLEHAYAGMTASDAMQENESYYYSIYNMSITKAVVTNHANAVQKASFGLYSNADGGQNTCFVALYEAHNKGRVTLAGQNETYFLVVDVMNYAEAEQVEVRGGSAAVVGGSNFGFVNATLRGPNEDHAGTLEISELDNSGTVFATSPLEIFIAKVTNTANGQVTVEDSVATLINVTNQGIVRVNGSNGGKYNAYDIINTGTVIIEKGTIKIEFTCNTNGTVRVSEGVTGTIGFPWGCMGNITGSSASQAVPSTVTLVPGGMPQILDVAVAKETIIAKTTIQGVSYTALNANATLKTSFENAMKNTFALAAGVSDSQVSVTLSAGSVLVDVRIEALTNATTFTEIKVPPANEILFAVEQVPGINAVAISGQNITASNATAFRVPVGSTNPVPVTPTIRPMLFGNASSVIHMHTLHICTVLLAFVLLLWRDGNK